MFGAHRPAETERCTDFKLWQISDRKRDVLTMTKKNSQDSKSQKHVFFLQELLLLGSSAIVKVNHVAVFGPSRGMRQQ